jgi:sortase A
MKPALREPEIPDIPPPPVARPRRRGRRLLRGFANAMIVVGAFLLLDAGITLVWQEPFSAIYAHQRQHALQRRLDVLDRIQPTPVERHVLVKMSNPDRRVEFAARAFDRRTHEGDPLGRLRIPKIGVSAVYVEGTATGDLRSGPGHYPGTPLPGEHGTVGIAGHRTTYGAWFRRINQLEPGDPIEITMAYGRFTYRVERTRIVPPTALWVTHRVGYDRLILSACNPLYSAAQRIVVFARLVDTLPRGAAA